MKYLAVFDPTGARIVRWFTNVMAAEQWLDSQNNNMEKTTLIEEYNEAGHKTDGFFYTECA